MAVPQLQLANLGEIFAQNQARQAEMDTMQLQQAEALAARDARIEKANREKLLREKLATGEVNLQSPEGFNQLLNMGVITPDQYLNANETLAAIAKNKAQGEAATRKAETAQQKLELDRQNIQSQIQNRNAQLQLSRAQEARMAASAKKEWGKVGFEMAQKLSQALMAAPEDQRPDLYLQMKQQYGGLAPQLFEDEAYSTEMGQVAQILANSGQSKAPSSTLGKLRADLQAGNITQEEFDAAQKKATTVSGEGSFKEYQYKAAQYGQRMNSASENMKSFENPSVLEKAFQKSGILGNFAQTPERQMYYQAQREFINAIKRQESGAAVADSEVEDYAQTYFPQPGDTPEVMQRKRQARERAIAGNKATAGGAWEEVGKAVSAVAESQPTPSGGGQGGGRVMSFEEFMSQ